MDIFSLQIQTIKEMLNWRVSLDIILIALLILYFYRTFKTTGTSKILLGIMIAAGIFILARFMDLKGIEWIYSNLSPIFLLALIIIFQPEIRKIFERAASIRRKESGGEAAKTSSIISDVIFALAKQKRGAIFVLPGQDSIRAWTSEGIFLDAQLSYPLLMSIFDPNSPGHDGAIVIEKGRVTSFAIHLPLSQSNNLSPDFGTRHHAGLGLSEVTDAFVIVVSEERGTVTLYYEGMAEVITDKNVLTSKIIAFWNYTASYHLFTKNNVSRKKTITQIIVSFVLAFLFWSTVVLTQNELKEMIYTLPIEYSPSPKNFTIKGDKPTEMTVNLIGTATDLNHINPTQLRIYVDLSTVTPGQKSIQIDEDNINLPKNVRVTKTKPPYIDIQVIEMREIEVAIEPQFIGNLPEGIEIDSIEVNPGILKILAPVDSLQQSKLNLITTPIYLDNIKQNTKFICNVIAPKNIQFIDQYQTSVEVNIRIITEKTSRFSIFN